WSAASSSWSSSPAPLPPAGLLAGGRFAVRDVHHEKAAAALGLDDPLRLEQVERLLDRVAGQAVLGLDLGHRRDAPADLDLPGGDAAADDVGELKVGRSPCVPVDRAHDRRRYVSRADAGYLG